MKGLNDDELLDFVRLTQQLPIHVRFIEYMPFSGNRWNYDKFLGYREMMGVVLGEWPGLTKIQDAANDTAKVWDQWNYSLRFSPPKNSRFLHGIRTPFLPPRTFLA